MVQISIIAKQIVYGQLELLRDFLVIIESVYIKLGNINFQIAYIKDVSLSLSNLRRYLLLIKSIENKYDTYDKCSNNFDPELCWLTAIDSNSQI